MPSKSRTYQDAIDWIDSLQSNAASLEEFRKSGKRLTQQSMEEVREYLQRIGYSPEELNRLNVIHVTGTKGKGSTCAFVDSILRHEKQDWTVGLYTSPHVTALRDRIRINGKPISEEEFAKFFFEVADRLEANPTKKLETTPPLPMYFRMITLVAFHAFMQLKVDATILEVGIGGTFDCTNVVPQPIVTGVTSLGIDHVTVLGGTLEEIAWHKGGIYKEGVPAFSVSQPQEALQVLEKQATDLKASHFTVVPLVPHISNVKLGIAGKHQHQNASLAVSLAKEFIRQIDSKTYGVPLTSPPESALLSPTVIAALENTKWPGRCQKIPDPGTNHALTTWFLDGAHTSDSLDFCVEWFFSPGVAFEEGMKEKQPLRVLIFNCTSGRAGPAFLRGMLAKAKYQWELHRGSVGETNAKAYFDHVIFSTNITHSDGTTHSDLPNNDTLPSMRTQNDLAAAWAFLVPEFPRENIHVLPSIEDAVNLVRKLEQSSSNEDHVQVLATGSLHLVGGVINVAGLTHLVM